MGGRGSLGEPTSLAQDYATLGRRVWLTRGNTATTTYSHDTADRLTALNQDVYGSSFDQGYTFDYSPASQMVSRVGDQLAPEPQPLGENSTR